MLYRTAVAASLFVFSLFLNAQNNNGPALTPSQQCPPGATCSTFPANAPVLHTRGESNTWKVEDFKPSDAAISCSVVKYEWDDVMPVLHLLCPGPQVFAPLRVHLTLTWKNENEVPDTIKTMRVDSDRNSMVQFKSQPGESRVELTLNDPDQTQSLKEWIKFTKVKVGLVPTQK
ncbi:MAG TPA: hypothetical protein VF532_23995 [Candidatus Angelobacter sp.]